MESIPLYNLPVENEIKGRSRWFLNYTYYTMLSILHEQCDFNNFVLAARIGTITNKDVMNNLVTEESHHIKPLEK